MNAALVIKCLLLLIAIATTTAVNDDANDDFLVVIYIWRWGRGGCWLIRPCDWWRCTCNFRQCVGLFVESPETDSIWTRHLRDRPWAASPFGTIPRMRIERTNKSDWKLGNQTFIWNCLMLASSFNFSDSSQFLCLIKYDLKWMKSLGKSKNFIPKTMGTWFEMRYQVATWKRDRLKIFTCNRLIKETWIRSGWKKSLKNTETSFHLGKFKEF